MQHAFIADQNKRLIHPRQQLRRRPRREPNPPACYPATERNLHLPGTPHISQPSCSHRRGSGRASLLPRSTARFLRYNPFPRSLPLPGVGSPFLLVGVDLLLWAIPESVSLAADHALARLLLVRPVWAFLDVVRVDRAAKGAESSSVILLDNIGRVLRNLALLPILLFPMTPILPTHLSFLLYTLLLLRAIPDSVSLAADHALATLLVRPVGAALRVVQANRAAD